MFIIVTRVINVTHNMITMPRIMISSALTNQQFLERLGKARPRERRDICQRLTATQMEAIAEVAKCVQEKKILILRRDKSHFRHEDFFLRIIASSTASDGRKRRQLIARHKVLPRLC